jgi:hypothetical protein
VAAQRGAERSLELWYSTQEEASQFVVSLGIAQFDVWVFCMLGASRSTQSTTRIETAFGLDSSDCN